MENKAAGQYLARVKRALVCDKTDRCRLLERCGDMIEVFLQENPEAGYDGIVAAFGEPDAFVSELLSGLDEVTVRAARKRRRLIRWGVVAVIVIALITTSIFWYLQYRESMNINEHAIIVKGVPQIMTEEEYDAIWKSAPEEARDGVWESLPPKTHSEENEK